MFRFARVSRYVDVWRLNRTQKAYTFGSAPNALALSSSPLSLYLCLFLFRSFSLISIHFIDILALISMNFDILQIIGDMFVHENVCAGRFVLGETGNNRRWRRWRRQRCRLNWLLWLIPFRKSIRAFATRISYRIQPLCVCVLIVRWKNCLNNKSMILIGSSEA